MMSVTPPRTPPSVLVVDDEPDLRTLYELTLLREGYRVDVAGTLAEARAHLHERRFDAVITDMRLPDGHGMELLRDLLAQQRPERCIVITAYGSPENAVEALKAGAFDYLTKPVDLKQFRTVVASAIQGNATPRNAAAAVGRDADPTAAATATTDAGASAPPGVHPGLRRLVGESQAMITVKERIVKVARSMAPVLVRGESGTGKELVARAIHACSHRADAPFVAVNCGAIPENLLEAEFFGAKKGSYTGSTQDRDGYFQAARGGTLFLDEIGDLPLAMQSKLLRAIQERIVRPIGSTQEDTVDVRIVSATHKDLAADVQASRFRQDLFYRLNVIEIAVPPLRERRGDLPALCEALLQRIAQEAGMPVPSLSADVLTHLCEMPLPGNVRELENLLHRAVALSDGDALHVDIAPSSAGAPLDGVAAPKPSPRSRDIVIPADLQAHLDELERDILVKALSDTGFNRTAAAARLGLSLRQIRYRIARLNIATPFTDDAHDDTA